LEGQVAVIGSGVLSPEERADIVDALFDSSMYRADQDSFMLYPARQLPSFLEKNVVPEKAVDANPLLRALLESGDQTVVTAGPDGLVRFDADFAKQDHLETALDELAEVEEWSDLVAAHRDQTLDAYEHVFNHHAYTGRSGSMYGYEGIGSIYWHMVAKLAVAVQESAFEAVAAGAAPETIERLVGAFWRVRAGLGFNKTATEFGAIPIDPYSHTPGHAGAQQPGMTGLVKEELLTRPAEVGVRVDGGEIHFDQLFLRGLELVTEGETWQLLDTTLGGITIDLSPGSLGTTLCQVPIVLSRTDGDAQIEIEFADGTTRLQPGSSLDAETSSDVFGRTGSVAKVTARVPSGPND
ncbi:MAG: hypothetical protein KJP12_00065, partial [Acidimicrobiia bacterium]|nr:hypothetical protein [Acidimicrobiia bacterium]